MEIAGILSSLYHEACEHLYVKYLINEFIKFTDKSCSNQRLKLAAICFFCDIIEYMPGSSFHSEIAR